jgi:hypothetical protein
MTSVETYSNVERVTVEGWLHASKSSRMPFPAVECQDLAVFAAANRIRAEDAAANSPIACLLAAGQEGTGPQWKGKYAKEVRASLVGVQGVGCHA